MIFLLKELRCTKTARFLCFCSINKKDRLLYRVKEEIVTVVVISAMGHYSDK
jgi:hypothetical protein